MRKFSIPFGAQITEAHFGPYRIQRVGIHDPRYEISLETDGARTFLGCKSTYLEALDFMDMHRQQKAA